jgi:hypothetical protein
LLELTLRWILSADWRLCLDCRESTSPHADQIRAARIADAVIYVTDDVVIVVSIRSLADVVAP